MSEGENGENQEKERLLKFLRAEISKNTNEDEKKFNSYFSHREIKNQMEFVHLQGWRDHYHLKNGWSFALQLLLCGMIIFQWVLLIFVGFGWWNFTQYKWLLPTVLIQNFGQIIGLAFIVVKSLFKDMEP